MTSCVLEGIVIAQRKRRRPERLIETGFDRGNFKGQVPTSLDLPAGMSSWRIWPKQVPAAQINSTAFNWRGIPHIPPQSYYRRSSSDHITCLTKGPSPRCAGPHTPTFTDRATSTLNSAFSPQKSGLSLFTSGEMFESRTGAKLSSTSHTVRLWLHGPANRTLTEDRNRSL